MRYLFTNTLRGNVRENQRGQKISTYYVYSKFPWWNYLWLEYEHRLRRQVGAPLWFSLTLPLNHAYPWNPGKVVEYQIMQWSLKYPGILSLEFRGNFCMYYMMCIILLLQSRIRDPVHLWTWVVTFLSKTQGPPVNCTGWMRGSSWRSSLAWHSTIRIEHYNHMFRDFIHIVVPYGSIISYHGQYLSVI